MVGYLQAPQEDDEQGASQSQSIGQHFGGLLADEHVADDEASHHHEDLGQGDVEVAHHVKFGQHGLGALAESEHLAVGGAEGKRLEDGLDVGVLGEVPEGAGVAEATHGIAAAAVALAPAQQSVEGFGHVGQDMAEHDRPEVLAHQFQGESKAVATGLLAVLLPSPLEVPVDCDGLEEEV